MTAAAISKYGFTTIGNVLYFLAEDGFYSISGQQVTPIGADKVNEWFLAHSEHRPARCRALHCRREQAAHGVGVSYRLDRHRSTTSRSSLIGRMAAGREPRFQRRSGDWYRRHASISTPTAPR